MGRLKPKYAPSPRVLDTFQVATRLGISEGTFRKRLSALEAQAFPRRDKFLGGWDADAIDLWFDLRAGIKNISQISSENMYLEAINGKH